MTTNETELRDLRYALNTYIDFIEFLENELGFIETKELIEKFNSEHTALQRGTN